MIIAIAVLAAFAGGFILGIAYGMGLTVRRIRTFRDESRDDWAPSDSIYALNALLDYLGVEL